jgi:S1-C subfamily serine protease/HEAT repeat protein
VWEDIFDFEMNRVQPHDGAEMRISFSCPSCAKTFEVPLSLAGKKGRCRKCGNEIVIPALEEAGPPGSLETIPVAAISAPAASEPEEEQAGDDDSLEYTLAAPEPAPPVKPTPVAPAPQPLAARPKSKTKTKPSSNQEPAPRPRWFIPAVIGGTFAVFFLVNFGTFLARSSRSSPVEIAQAQPPDIGDFTKAAPSPPKPVPSPTTKTKAKPASTNPAPAARPPVVAVEPVEEVPGRLMTSSDIVARYEASVALIKGKKGTGTGFIVRQGVVATNAHVIDGERTKDIEVRFPSADKARQGPFAAKILFQDKIRDLVLLGVATDLPPVRIAEGYKFIKGEDVTVIGNPGVGGQMVLENAISRGIVSSMTKLNNHAFIQLSIAINPGNSGGPVFDTKGRVIGVVTLKTTKQEGLAFAIPVEDLVSALGNTSTVAINGPDENPTGSTASAPATGRTEATAPTLAYGWKSGQTYVYSFELTLEVSQAVLALKGNSIYRVKAVDASGITLAHQGWFVVTKRTKDGRVMPGGTGSPELTKEIEVKIDPQGEVLSASGSSPLPLLGDFSMLLIEPLPDDDRRTWDDAKTITLNEVEQVPGSGGGVPKLGRPGVNNLPGGNLRSRMAQRGRAGSRIGGRAQPAPKPQPQPRPSGPTVKVTAHEATEETSYTLGERKGDAAPIRKDYELVTTEMVGNQPRLKMTGEGAIAFDIKAGIPLGLDYKLTVVENSGNTTFRLPITVRCKLLEGKDRELGLRPPIYAPTAMNKIDSSDLARIVTILKTGDNNQKREALRLLTDSAPMENKRPEVSRVLERLANDKDMGVRSDVIKAMGVWGDKKIVESLIASLGNESYGVRDELYEALSRVSPTEKTAEAIIAWLAKDQNRASKALRAIGAPAEAPLLQTVESGSDPRVRLEACRLLKEVGTSQSVPTLQKIAQWKQGGDVGRNAEVAIRSITQRWPSDDELTTLIKQLRASDGGRRREAADRLIKCSANEARRAEVARGLEGLLGDPDNHNQSMAFRALAVWGDARSRAAIIDKLDDPGFRSVREAIDALGKLGPDEASARAIAGRLKKERGPAIEALTVMGSIAEPVALGALKEAGNDGFLRNDLLKLLGKIGTSESLSTLRDAASSASPREAGETKRALKEVEDRVGPDGGAGALSIASYLDDLKSTDARKRKDAVQRLTNLAPTDADRATIARALDAVWDLDDFSVKRLLREAVVRWGDDKSADLLTDRLAKPDFKSWDDAIYALVALRADARTGELLVGRFTRNPNLVSELGKKFPTVIEPLIVAIALKEGEARLRAEACRTLGQLGTPAVLPDLQTLASKAQEVELGKAADETLKVITARQ